MTYNKVVTARIVDLWCLGATAEGTVAELAVTGIKVGLATVYRHRHGIAAQQILAKLLREQLRDISECPDVAVRLKYRDKLLERLMTGLRQELPTIIKLSGDDFPQKKDDYEFRTLKHFR
jgi:hypothetical protein